MRGGEAVRSPKRLQVALATAAEHYERLVAAGELKSDAFRLAMATLGRNSRGASIVAVPAELPALIEAIVRSQVSGDWRGAVREVTTGRSRLRADTGLRALVAHVLLRNGYHPLAIGLALGRDRATIIQQDRVFRRRLAADQLLAARVERLLAAAPAERSAA